jgi:hypothetical protein
VHAVHTSETEDVHQIFVGKPDGKRIVARLSADVSIVLDSTGTEFSLNISSVNASFVETENFMLCSE